MKVSAAQLRAALDKPSPDVRLYLLHGPDESTALDHAARLARAMGGAAERVDLDGAALKADPARLPDEAAALSLFGDRRHVRVRGVGEESLEAITALLAAERAGNPVLAVAPSLKTTSKVVALALASPAAMVFGCYPPSDRDAEAMVAAIAREHGLRTTPDAARRLAEATNNDRAVLTREIEKIALFLDADADRPHDVDDAVLDAIGADLGEAIVGEAVEAVVAGDPAALGHVLRQFDESGVAPIPWLRALGRRLVALADMRAEIDRGGDPAGVMKRARINFREEATTARALRTWSPTLLARALDRVREAERAVIAPANAGDVLAGGTALDLARGMARRR